MKTKYKVYEKPNGDYDVFGMQKIYLFEGLLTSPGSFNKIGTIKFNKRANEYIYCTGIGRKQSRLSTLKFIAKTIEELNKGVKSD